MAGYHVMLVARGGTTKSWHTDKAPDTQRMCQRAARWNAVAVVRYWPSKKGWRVLDTKDIRKSPRRPGYFKGGYMPDQYVGYRYLEPIFPGEEAATMAAILLSGG